VGDEPQTRPSDQAFGDPTRRTYLAAERTVLSWWRTAFATVGVALAVGRLLPAIAHLSRGPFVALGVGWGALACAFIVCGSLRQRRGEQAMETGGYLRLNPAVATAFTVYMLALTIATIIISLWAT
jgi:uncharacterized membrane protein YidH (DUF202 family)